MIEKLELQTQVKTWTVAEKPKIKVLCLSIWYPLSMSRYFERAFRRRDDVDFVAVGSYTGSNIPWMGGMNLKEKYSKSPELPLPFPPNVSRISYDFVKAQLPKDWIPDLVLSIDAGVNWTSKPQDGLVATIATDPHCLNYYHQRKISDKFFNMQLCYSQQGDVYLPYAFSPDIHYATEAEKDTDAVLIGMPYENRVRWVNELRKHDVSVIFENSPVFDEYRELANRARIGLNWSSLNDLNARFFETPAFGLAPVTNRVPDMHLFLTENEDYLGFSDLGEAVEKVLYLKDNPKEIERLSVNANEKIQGHTYDARIQHLLEECNFA